MGVLWRLSQLLIADYITSHFHLTLRKCFSNLNTKNKKIRLIFWGFQWQCECWSSWRPALQLPIRFCLKFVNVLDLFDALKAISMDIRDIVSDSLQLGFWQISSTEASTSISGFHLYVSNLVLIKKGEKWEVSVLLRLKRSQFSSCS